MNRRSLIAGLFGGALGSAIVAGADVAPPRTQPDWVMALEARRALWNDPRLCEVNLGVRVVDGEAVVWGPVLTQEMAAEAVARIQLVAGVKNVVSELYVLPADDLLRRKLLPSQPAPQARRLPEVIPVDQWRPAVEAVRPIPTRIVDLVDEARNRQVRFRALQVEVSNGVVNITSSPDRNQDAMDFANLARQIPGVANVVVRIR